MNTSVLTGSIGFLGAIVVAGLTGFFAYMGVLRKAKSDDTNSENTLETALRKELREDRAAARLEAKEAKEEAEKERKEYETKAEQAQTLLNQKIDELTREVGDLKRKIGEHQSQSEAAERAARLAMREAENARAEADGWKARFEKEQDECKRQRELVDSLSIMYEAASKQRPPDAVMLAVAEDTMRKAGFISAPPKTDETKEEKP